MEAEFAVVMDGVQVKPEDIFGSPRKIIREKMMHRKGRSYHLPTGGAVYFDTGVVEVATPVIEIERGCAARAGRSLWEAILFVRQELDAWEQAHDADVQLAGFSTHYNISFEVPRTEQGTTRTVEQLAYLLSHVLPVPVMLLAANRRSTGIGVRPRADRIEITAERGDHQRRHSAERPRIDVRAARDEQPHHVVLRYRSRPLLAGCLVLLAGLLAFAFIGALWLRRRGVARADEPYEAGVMPSGRRRSNLS